VVFTTYVINVDASHTPEEGAHSPSGQTGLLSSSAARAVYGRSPMEKGWLLEDDRWRGPLSRGEAGGGGVMQPGGRHVLLRGGRQTGANRPAQE
jgi:hypothetical protein